MGSRLREQYNSTLKGEMQQEFGIQNVMDVPHLSKIVLNMGVGDAKIDARLLENAMEELATITGQKPAIRQARRSVASFKLRKGMNIACTVTLRGERMYEFMDRLFNVAIPRIRDFRGLPPNAFDRQGNYTFGLKDQTIFPELNIDKISHVRGMNVTFVFEKSEGAEQSRALLRKFGMPFRN